MGARVFGVKLLLRNTCCDSDPARPKRVQQHGPSNSWSSAHIDNLELCPRFARERAHTRFAIRRYAGQRASDGGLQNAVAELLVAPCVTRAT